MILDFVQIDEWTLNMSLRKNDMSWKDNSEDMSNIR